MDLHVLERAYKSHKQGAKQRGIGFDLTFGAWLAIWNESGKMGQRGVKSPDHYVMARHGDKGGYEVGNVSIKTHRENIQEAHQIMAEDQRAQFLRDNGVTVLQWLKDAIAWHWRVAGTMPIDDPRFPPGYFVTWPASIECGDTPAMTAIAPRPIPTPAPSSTATAG